MEAADGFTVSDGLEDDYRVGAAVLEKPDPAELRRTGSGPMNSPPQLQLASTVADEQFEVDDEIPPVLSCSVIHDDVLRAALLRAVQNASHGGGGNQRVRGRTDKRVYERSSP